MLNCIQLNASTGGDIFLLTAKYVGSSYAQQVPQELLEQDPQPLFFVAPELDDEVACP